MSVDSELSSDDESWESDDEAMPRAVVYLLTRPKSNMPSSELRSDEYFGGDYGVIPEAVGL